MATRFEGPEMVSVLAQEESLHTAAIFIKPEGPSDVFVSHNNYYQDDGKPDKLIRDIWESPNHSLVLKELGFEQRGLVALCFLGVANGGLRFLRGFQIDDPTPTGGEHVPANVDLYQRAAKKGHTVVFSREQNPPFPHNNE